MSMITCENLYKIYKTKEIEVVALQGLDMEINEGEVVGIIGNSGSGKTSLLNMIGGLDRPTAGRLIVDGKDLLKVSDRELKLYKRDTVGFVWQNNARNMIQYLTAVENVELPSLMRGKPDRKKALQLLEMVGLSHRYKNKLQELSGGEQQRVAIATSIMTNPKLILADEPTGNVDTLMSDMILKVFNDLSKTLGVTVIIVTHDPRLSQMVDRVISISDGRVSSEFIREKNYKQTLEELDPLNKEFHGIVAEPQGLSETHEEYLIMDRVGRIQFPNRFLEDFNLGSSRRIKVIKENGKIVMYPPEINTKDISK